MKIKDLALTQELAREEQAAVRGGGDNTVLALMAGSTLLNGATGVSVGSPVVQANPQSQTLTPKATDVTVDTKIANVLQSANTLLGQF
jgi:hypothetical protein